MAFHGGLANQQSSYTHVFPIIEGYVSTVCASGTDHYVDLPPDIAAGELVLVFYAQAGGGGAVGWPAGWGDSYWQVEPKTDGNLTVGAFALHADANTYLNPTVNFVSNSSAPLVAQAFRISYWINDIFNLVAVGSFDTLTPPSLTSLYADWPNLWFSVLHSAMSGTYSASPAGYADYRSVSSGTTASDAQLHTSILYNTAETETPSAWIFDSPSGKYAAGHLVITGIFVE